MKAIKRIWAVLHECDSEPVELMNAVIIFTFTTAYLLGWNTGLVERMPLAPVSQTVALSLACCQVWAVGQGNLRLRNFTNLLLFSVALYGTILDLVAQGGQLAWAPMAMFSLWSWSRTSMEMTDA